ncbi:hypothetical protein HPP92_020524 [Vanilla planifolia]|uniref:Uncharacterized protein n=1 Tax=Vanilla planifolia TaxID=51239 RepID=A0A835UKW2_VANPL|nr:hypothetical protein HPP92_020524 [Vanilla planifolia]
MVRRMVSEGDARWLRIRPCEVWWAGINLGVILDDAYMGQQTEWEKELNPSGTPCLRYLELIGWCIVFLFGVMHHCDRQSLTDVVSCDVMFSHLSVICSQGHQYAGQMRRGAIYKPDIRDESTVNQEYFVMIGAYNVSETTKKRVKQQSWLYPLQDREIRGIGHEINMRGQLEMIISRSGYAQRAGSVASVCGSLEKYICGGSSKVENPII